MKNNKKFHALNLILTAILALMLGLTAQAQSTDIDNPTPLTSNVITGENDGRAETLYYSFTATKGDVKITFDGKITDYSDLIYIDLLNEDGSEELLEISARANNAGNRTVGTKRFLSGQKVILRISIDKDALRGGLTYKIKIEGAVKLDTSSASEETTTDDEDEAVSKSDSKKTTPKKAPTKDKLKNKTKKIVDAILDN